MTRSQLFRRSIVEFVERHKRGEPVISALIERANCWKCRVQLKSGLAPVTMKESSSGACNVEMVGDGCASMPVGWHVDVNRANFERSPTDVWRSTRCHSPSSSATRTAIAISSNLFCRRFVSRFAGPVRQCRLPRIQVQSERAICRIHMVSKDASGERTDEGPSMSRTPSSTHRTVLFFTSTASKNQLSSVPMKLMQPFASIRARLVRRRR